MACTDMAIRLLEVDGLAMGSSASKKSWSLELLLTLHAVVGCTVLCGARPSAVAPSTARARCAMRLPIDALQTHMVWRCTAEGDGLSSDSGPSRRRGLRACLMVCCTPG